MTLSIGQRLGPLEILAPLGAGGMGEVYRARDTKLGREVAVKALPEGFAKDEARLARFEREAKLLAALNHPGIATLYGVEETERERFLVMELVEGETLAEILARGPLPFDEALPLFRQIALALESAHEKGIVHRDLKPANIKVTPGETVKVLDFGLAKLAEPASSLSVDDGSHSPTLTRDTGLGTILGTASYMSPEQAKGKSVDARTDVWSFGCVLYEALAGRKAFSGETVTDTIAAVVKSEPDWGALPAETPPRVRAVLERCLRKDPSRRLHSIADVRIDLEEADSVPPAGVPRRGHAVSFAGGFLLATLLAATLFWIRSEPPIDSESKRLTMQIPSTDRVVFSFLAPVVSPDGKYVAYVARRDSGPAQVFLRSLDSFQASPIEGTEGVQFAPFFSPDGQWLVFVDDDFKKIPVAGGIPVPLAELAGAASAYGGASWEQDDRLIVSDEKSLLLLTDSGPEIVFRAEPGERLYWPRLLPGNEGVLFTSVVAPRISVVAARLDSGERRILVVEGHDAVYLETGHIVFSRQDSLFAAPFRPEALDLVGTPIPVLEGLRGRGVGFRGQFSISRNGTLLYVPETTRQDTDLTELVWVDRRGDAEPLSELKRIFAPHPRLSPDGRRLAVALSPEGSLGSEIWLLEIGRETLTRVASSAGAFSTRPFWSADGRSILFAADGAILSQPVDGSGGPVPLETGPYRIPTSVSSDGRTVIFREDDPRPGTVNRNIGMLRLDANDDGVILLDSSFDEHSGVLSPDDSWLAYVSDESGREEVYARRFPGLEGRTLISTDGGTEPLWSRDGKELFYRNGDRMMAVRILSTTPELEVSRPETLFEGRYESGLYYGNPGLNYDVAPDGRFVMIRAEEVPGETSLHVVLDWFEELNRLVPHPSPP